MKSTKEKKSSKTTKSTKKVNLSLYAVIILKHQLKEQDLKINKKL